MSHNGKKILIEVRVWPWLIIRSFRIKLDSKVMYQEGAEPYKVTTLSEYAHIVTLIILIFGSLMFIGHLIPSCP